MSYKALAVFNIFKIDVGLFNNYYIPDTWRAIRQFSASLVEKNLLNQDKAINQAMKTAKLVLIHKFSN